VGEYEQMEGELGNFANLYVASYQLHGTLQRDRAQMIFNGTFYFAAPVDGHVTGAVFIGEGHFNAAVPPNEFEKGNLKRLLGTDVVD